MVSSTAGASSSSQMLFGSFGFCGGLAAAGVEMVLGAKSAGVATAGRGPGVSCEFQRNGTIRDEHAQGEAFAEDTHDRAKYKTN